MALESYRGQTPTIAEDAYVHPAATVIGDVEVGAQSSVWPGVVLRGDDAPIRIGPQTSIQDGSVLHTTKDLSRVDVGRRVTVGHMVLLHGCTVEDECLIGMGSVILDGAVIGRGSVVGAGSLITMNKHIPPGSLVLGSPAQVVRPCGEKEQALIDRGWREYTERTREYRERDAAS